MSQPQSPTRVNIDDDDVQLDNYGSMLLYRDVPFTGEVVETDGDTIIELKTYRNGRTDGIQRTFDSEGRVRTEYTAVDGKAVGVYTRWYETGRVAERKEFDEFGSPRKVEAWTPEGELKPDSFDSW